MGTLATRTIRKFNAKLEDWNAYVERFEQYLGANDIVNAVKQHTMLLSICGTSTYTLLCSLVAL